MLSILKYIKQHILMRNCFAQKTNREGCFGELHLYLHLCNLTMTVALLMGLSAMRKAVCEKQAPIASCGIIQRLVTPG